MLQALLKKTSLSSTFKFNEKPSSVGLPTCPATGPSHPFFKPFVLCEKLGIGRTGNLILALSCQVIICEAFYSLNSWWKLPFVRKKRRTQLAETLEYSAATPAQCKLSTHYFFSAPYVFFFVLFCVFFMIVRALFSKCMFFKTLILLCMCV